MTRPILGRLGPFIGGMNTSSAPSAISDNELVDCINFEIDIDGSLVSRPPILDVSTGSPDGNNHRKLAIGNGIIGGHSYVFFYVPNAGVYAFDGSVWTSVGAPTNLVSFCCVQVADLIFFLPTTASVGLGGYWNGAAWTSDANMPKAEAAVLYRQRIWTVPGIGATATATSHQLRFTEPINPAAPTPLVWTATNSISVNPGDGQRLVDIQIYNDNLLLFKQDSIYAFAYDVLPEDGAVKAVNTTIGSSGRNCVTSHDNASFVYHEGSVYEIINYTLTKLNIKVPFILDSTIPTGFAGPRVDPVFLTVVGDRLILRYFNRIYMYATRTRSWSRWTSDTDTLANFGPLTEMPKLAADGSLVEYFGGSCIDDMKNAYRIQNGFDSEATENITCTIVSKTYDFGQSSQYKKLAWWGVDIFGANSITGVLTPVYLATSFTWGQLHNNSWESLNTWQQPIVVDTSITTSMALGRIPQRSFLKFLKAIRFRQVSFEVTMSNDGTEGSGPERIYSLTTVVGIKQLVPEAAN